MHRTIEQTLESLVVPAGLVADDGTLIYSNPLQREILGVERADWRELELNVKELLAEAGLAVDNSNCLVRALEGESTPCVGSYEILGQRWWGVSSWLPRSYGWPQVLLWTQRIQPNSAAVAIDMHCRDALAVSHAIEIDELRRMTRTIVNLTQELELRTEALGEGFVERTSMVEPQLPHS